jgi:hypothetical protein
MTLARGAPAEDLQRAVGHGVARVGRKALGHGAVQRGGRRARVQAARRVPARAAPRLAALSPQASVVAAHMPDPLAECWKEPGGRLQGDA